MASVNNKNKKQNTMAKKKMSGSKTSKKKSNATTKKTPIDIDNFIDLINQSPTDNTENKKNVKKTKRETGDIKEFKKEFKKESKKNPKKESKKDPKKDLKKDSKKESKKDLDKKETENKFVLNTILEKPSASIPKKITAPVQIGGDMINKALINNFLEAKKFLVEHNIKISTITLDCKLHTLINVDVFAKNVILCENEIVSVKFGNRKDPATNRTIVILKTKKKPSAKNFYNQVTILMKPTNNTQHSYINIKVFKNGSLQMTGCKDMDDFFNVTTTLIDVLKRGRDIEVKGKKTHLSFVEEPDKIGIFDIRIRMINSNFNLGYKVDRKKLARILKKKHRINTKDKEIGYVECKYEPTGGHSCVNIKYQYDENNKPSIFVFQTGAVIITGAKNLSHIIKAYEFIIKILNKYHNEVRIIDLDQKLVQAEIAKFFQTQQIQQNQQIQQIQHNQQIQQRKTVLRSKKTYSNVSIAI